MAKKFYFLLKIYKEEKYADAFLNEGEIYMQKLRDFQMIEDGGIRGDKHEGIVGWHQPKDIRIKIQYKDKDGIEKTHTINSQEIIGPVVTGANSLADINIFCMYSFFINEFKFEYDDEDEESKEYARVKAEEFLRNELLKIESSIELGGYAVIILDTKKFLSLVDDKLANSNYYYRRDFVEYFDPDLFSGSFKLGDAPFRKRLCYSNQSEYRIAFRDDLPPSVRKIRVGDISHIAIKTKVEDIKNIVHINVKELRDEDSENVSTYDV